MKYLVLISAIAVLGGCASAPSETSMYRDSSYDQYCKTTQQITVRDGETVDSVTKLDCSDDLLDKMVMNKPGINENCNYFNNRFMIGGKHVIKTGIWCTLPNGDHVIVDDDIHN